MRLSGLGLEEPLKASGALGCLLCVPLPDERLDLPPKVPWTGQKDGIVMKRQVPTPIKQEDLPSDGNH